VTLAEGVPTFVGRRAPAYHRQSDCDPLTPDRQRGPLSNRLTKRWCTSQWLVDHHRDGSRPMARIAVNRHGQQLRGQVHLFDAATEKAMGFGMMNKELVHLPQR
jgi:hypothetical protein